MPPTAELPQGLPFVYDNGVVGVLSGKVEPISLSTGVTSSWAQKRHPLYNIWVEDEAKQRASYIATVRHLRQFIVPHRFEGSAPVSKLSRARLGYGIGLNKAYLHEIFGHIRGTPAHYWWGGLGGPSDQDIITPPTGGLAHSTLWDDATGDGVNWTNFFEGRVLEWMLTSPGGFVLVDSTRQGREPITQAQAAGRNVRPVLRHIPMGWVEDYSRGSNGYRWIKLAETEDARQPRNPDSKFLRRHVLYELNAAGNTIITRVDDDGKTIGAPIIQTFRDIHGQGILPLVEARFGEHPDVPNLGSGLLMGLDDIVIDLYNVLTEIREAFRDAAFGFLTYVGDDFQAAHQQLEDGTRLVNVGSDINSKLERVAADSAEVSAGISVFDIGLKNWSLSAKRRAMEIMEASSARSGVSLKAEFQLDLRPLLVSVCENLDEVETNVMFILAQMQGETPQRANELKVRRETEFQLEQEASRISRIVGEFLMAGIPAMPKSLLKRLIERWAASIDFLNLDEPVGDGQTGTLREAISREAEQITTAEQTAKVREREIIAEGPPEPAVGGGA